MLSFAAKLWLFFGMPLALLATDETARQDPFADLSAWVVEQAPGGTVQVQGGTLQIRDKNGCTVWLRVPLTAPVSISYDATVLATGRVSDLNCFWMASDPRHPDDLFFPEHGRNGLFASYDVLQTYYVGYGGNSNSTTRFRRYEGGGVKPLLPEHDLREKSQLLESNRTYHIELIAADGSAEFKRDGVTLFRYRDPKPLTRGWFGFRTVDANIDIRNFRIKPLKPVTKS